MANPRKLDAWLTFGTFDQWLEKVSDLTLDDAVPLITAGKYRRAEKLLLLAWVDSDLAIAAELVALTTLELSVTDVYGVKAEAWAIVQRQFTCPVGDNSPDRCARV